MSGCSPSHSEDQQLAKLVNGEKLHSFAGVAGPLRPAPRRTPDGGRLGLARTGSGRGHARLDVRELFDAGLPESG